MTFAGVLDKDSLTGIWTLSGIPFTAKDFPRNMALDGNWYFFTPNTVLHESLREILDDRDSVFALDLGDILTMEIFIPNPQDEDRPGSMLIVHPSLWGMKNYKDKGLILNEAIFRQTNFMRAGVPSIKCGYAGTAMAWFRRDYPGKTVNGVDYPTLTILPHRWREIAHEAFHGGPIACLRGGSPNAVEIDITGAFLHAMSLPIPLTHEADASYQYIPSIKWKMIRTYFGFVEALVNVPVELGRGLPPLPVNEGDAVVYPTGIFRGVWSIDLLIYAEEHCGVKVLNTYDHAVLPRGYTYPVFQDLARRWFHIADKTVSKSLYTRFWGKWGNRGGYVGSIAKPGSKTPEGCVPKSGFFWNNNFIDQNDDAPVTYRPDIAATIAAYNHIAVQKAIRLLDPQSIISVHVDAIWTDDIKGAEKVCETLCSDPTPWATTDSAPGSWRVKHQGNLRFWGCGVYHHNGRFGHSGFKGRPTVANLDRFMRADRQDIGMVKARQWDNGISSANSVLAQSSAPNYKNLTTQRKVGGIPITDESAWTRAGFFST